MSGNDEPSSAPVSTAVRSVAAASSQAEALHALADHLDRIEQRMDNGASGSVIQFNRSTIGLLIGVGMTLVANVAAVANYGAKIGQQVEGLTNNVATVRKEMREDNREIHAQLRNLQERVGRIEGRIGAAK